MQRMFELIEEIKIKYPEDKFFENIEEVMKDPLAYEQYKIYENAMQSLDEDSWELMFDKALVAFKSNYKPKKVSEAQFEEKINKRSFFDHLNETFGYQFLVSEGYKNVRLLAEDKNKKHKSPDLTYEKKGIKYYCDVKTINRSDDDMERYKKGDSFSGLVYLELSEPFLNKMATAIESGLKQIESKNATGMVYIVVSFDDIGGTYYYKYQQQIVNLLRKFPDLEVYIRIGTLGKIWMHKKADMIDFNGPYCLKL